MKIPLPKEKENLNIAIVSKVLYQSELWIEHLNLELN